MQKYTVIQTSKHKEKMQNNAMKRKIHCDRHFVEQNASDTQRCTVVTERCFKELNKRRHIKCTRHKMTKTAQYTRWKN